MLRRSLLPLLLLCAAAPGLALGEDKKKKTGGESFLSFDTLTATTNKGGGRRGVMTVDCGLDVQDPALRARAQAFLPRLRAAYLQTVMIYAGGLSPGMEPNADYLERTFQRQTDEMLGRPGARVLLGAIQVN